jgi:CBS domain-containing protein
LVESASTTSLIRVSDVMTTDVAVAGMTEPLNEAVYRMLERNVGCIVVTDWGSVIGILTKGDVLRKAFLKGLEAREVSVKVAMSHPVVTIDPDATIEEASKIMTTKHISKLPVIKDRKLVGVITMSDIIRAEPTQVGYLQELVRARFVPHDLA